VCEKLVISPHSCVEIGVIIGGGVGGVVVRSGRHRLQIGVGDRRVEMDRDEVIKKLRGIKPGRIREHAVKVEDVYHPVKEAFARVTGLDLLDFNTNTARNAFKRLGFEVSRLSTS
jgi:hypothetical protein